MILLCIVPVFVSAQTPKAVETAIIRHLDSISRNADNQAVLDRENKALRMLLLAQAKKPAILKHDFKGLAGKMFVATSKDGNFRIYSWDTNTGGTMKFFDGVYQYRSRRGRVYSKAFVNLGAGVPGSFFSEIFQMDAGKKRVYLANSHSILSTSQARQDLHAFAIEGETLNLNVRLIKTPTAIRDSVGFDFDFFSVVDRKERPVKLFHWDEARKQFRFPVVLADKKFPNGGRVTDRFITYRFDGKVFVRLSR